MVGGEREMKGKTEKRLLMYVEAIVVLLILAVINFLGTRMFYRVDLTGEKLYTLSQSTKDVVRALPDVLNVQVFISGKVPPEMVSMVGDVRDLLNEYEAYGGKNFRLQFKDPSLDTRVADQARRLGIQELQVQVVKKDRMEVVSAWLGIAIEYEDKKEVIPSIVSIQNLEYQLTSTIVKITQGNIPKIGILNIRGPQMQGMQQNRFSTLGQMLSEEFEVVQINFDAEEKIPEDITALIITDTWGISDFGKYLIDQYLMRGGKLIWLIDGITIGQGLEAYPSLPGVEDMMRKWGVNLDRRLVLDMQAAQAAFQTGWGTIMMRYPCWVEILSRNFDQDFPVTAKLENVTFPWASPVKADKPADTPPEASFEVKPVMFTSERAWLMQSPFNLDPSQDWERVEKLEAGRQSVAVHASGIFASAFAGQEIPAPPVPGAAEGQDPGLSPDLDVPEKIEISSKPGEILAVGNARFANDEFLPQFLPNRIFLMNVADYFGYGNKLIGIRSRGETSRPIDDELTSLQRNIYRYGNLIIVPLLVVIYGFVRWMFRRRARARIAAKYSGGGA